MHSDEDFVLLNVYAPCDIGSQIMLWETLSTRLANYVGHLVCACGDFNVVRGPEERRSTGNMQKASCVASFNNFIDANDLVDLPLIGRRFTWYRGDGHSMSRIDRFLKSESWCSRWPNYLQAAQLRGLSDHCGLILPADEQNWGPCPFRMLKC